MLTDKQVAGLRAYLAQRQEVFWSFAEEEQKRADAMGVLTGMALSLHAASARGQAAGLATALAAIRAIESEGAEPWIDDGLAEEYGIGPDSELERHGAT